MKRVLFILIGFSFPLLANFPIECIGRTEVTYKSVEPDSWHRVTCYNPVQIDWDQHRLICLNPKTESHVQVLFEDSERNVYADNLTILYDSDRETLALEEINLFGNVKLISYDKPENSSHLQYALADRLEYRHGNEEFFLLAKSGHNVLYFDETHNYTMSAPKIVVTRNPITKKPSIKGEGLVRFIFKEEELKQFKQHFGRSTLSDESI